VSTGRRPCPIVAVLVPHRSLRSRLGRDSAAFGAAGALVCVAISGCGAAVDRINQAQQAYASGNAEAGYAILAADDDAGLRDEVRSRLLWLLEEGTMAGDTGRFGPGWTTLTEASRLADRFDLEWSKTTVGEELGSIAANDTVRTFRGTYADRIQLEVERMLVALAGGNGYAALIAARRAIERQRDIEIEQAKRIAAVDQEIAKRGGGAAVQGVLAQQGVDLSQAYGPYLNPIASWLSGLLQSSTGDGNDRQRGDTDLRRAQAMVPGNTVLAAQVERNPFDLARSGQPQVIVLFENGVGPRLEQITIPFITPWLGLSTIPLPRFVPTPLPAMAAEVTGGGATVRTELLADLTAIWKRDFDQRLPEIILRTALMVAAKEAATYAAASALSRQADRGSDAAAVGQVLVLIGASLYKGITNVSDLRMWRSIPGEVQIAQLPRPAEGAVVVTVLGVNGPTPGVGVALPDAPVSLLLVRSSVPGQIEAMAVPLAATSSAPAGGVDSRTSAGN
jgi:hypothetical protein